MPGPRRLADAAPAAQRIARLLCVLLLLAPGALVPVGAEALAQQRVTVSGSVRDAESGETLPYASVVVEETTLGAAANVDGFFVLVGVPAGKRTVRATYLGYRPATVEIDTETLEGPLRIELVPAATYLDEVLVTAEQYQMMNATETVSKITVSPKDMASLPNVGEVDIFRSLQLLPGVSGANEGSSGLYVRGGAPDQNLVLLDGMTVYHVDHFFGFFSAFNADAIKDVQIYKGGFPAAYGGRTSSIIDLTGRTGGNDYGLGVGLNLLSAGMLAEAPIGQRGSVLVSARRSYTDILQTGLYNSIYETLTGENLASDQDQQAAGGGFPRPGGGRALGGGLQGPGLATVQPDFYFYDLNAKLNYRPTDKDVVALSFYNGRDNLNESRFTTNTITRGGQEGATILNDVYDVTGWGNLGASGKWSRQWSPRFYSNALLAYSQYFSDNERAQLNERYAAGADTLLGSWSLGGLENNRLGDFSLRLDNEWQISQAHNLGFGLQATHSDVKYENVRNDTLIVFDEKQNTRQAAVYLQDAWKPLAKLRLVAGARGAYHDLTGETYLEPRASFRYDLTDQMRIKGAYGRYNQFVSRVVNENVTEGARDFWLLADGENVGVQGATHYIVGASYETPTWLFDVEAYRKDLTGLSEFSLRFRRGGADFQADNLFFDGEGAARGVEFLLQRKATRYTGWVSYTLAEVEHTFEGLNNGQPFPALHDQPHELKAVGSARLGQRWNLSATWVFATGKPYTAPESQYSITLLDGTGQSYIHVGEKNGERLPAYHRLDAAVHYRFPIGAANVDLGFSVFNLYNRTNVWYKEFDLTEAPFLTTDVTFLGVTPNLSLRVDL